MPSHHTLFPAWEPQPQQQQPSFQHQEQQEVNFDNDSCEKVVVEVMPSLASDTTRSSLPQQDFAMKAQAEVSLESDSLKGPCPKGTRNVKVDQGYKVKLRSDREAIF